MSVHGSTMLVYAVQPVLRLGKCLLGEHVLGCTCWIGLLIASIFAHQLALTRPINTTFLRPGPSHQTATNPPESARLRALHLEAKPQPQNTLKLICPRSTLHQISTRHETLDVDSHSKVAHIINSLLAALLRGPPMFNTYKDPGDSSTRLCAVLFHLASIRSLSLSFHSLPRFLIAIC